MTPERRDKEVDKALRRFFDFSTRAKDEKHLKSMINRRTEAMTNTDKLLIWYDVLRLNKYFGCARHARSRVAELRG